MKRGGRRALQACAFFLGVPAFAADLSGARIDLGHVEDTLSNLERRFLVPEMMERSNRLTARLNDGQLLFIMKDYDRAAMALLDVVDDPKNRAHPAYRDALFYLAESLFALRNYRPAAQYYAEVSTSGTPGQRQQSVARLLEIALATHDAAAAQTYLARAGDSRIKARSRRSFMPSASSTIARGVSPRRRRGSRRCRRRIRFIGVRCISPVSVSFARTGWLKRRAHSSTPSRSPPTPQPKQKRPTRPRLATWHGWPSPASSMSRAS